MKRREEQLRTLGQAVAQQRELRHISQREMAAMLGYTNHAHLSRIESGKKAPSLAVLFEIADILEVNVRVFFANL